MPLPPASPARTILIVEDDALVRLVAAEILEDAGLLVLEAEDADGAWRILEGRDDVGALFTDVDMPGSMSGIALCRRVAERWPGIRMAFTSGRPPAYLGEPPVPARFVPKPYRPADVLGVFAA